MSDSHEQSNEELRLLYQTSVTELEFFKRQQWSVTNYALLLYAAIVGITRLLDGDVSSLEKLVLCLVATIVATLGVYILFVLNNSIDIRRARLAAIRTEFTALYQSAWVAKEKDDKIFRVFSLLILVKLIGVVTVWWLVFFKM